VAETRTERRIGERPGKDAIRARFDDQTRDGSERRRSGRVGAHAQEQARFHGRPEISPRAVQQPCEGV
jgi:hypothetical protein